MVVKMSVVQKEILLLLIISERQSQYDFNDIMGMPPPFFRGNNPHIFLPFTELGKPLSMHSNYY